jgi:hypothetical protein
MLIPCLLNHIVPDNYFPSQVQKFAKGKKSENPEAYYEPIRLRSLHQIMAGAYLVRGRQDDKKNNFFVIFFDIYLKIC